MGEKGILRMSFGGSVWAMGVILFYFLLHEKVCGLCPLCSSLTFVAFFFYLFFLWNIIWVVFVFCLLFSWYKASTEDNECRK